MLFGVKYCGGCNPRYERGTLLNRVKEYFQHRVSFELANEDQMYDGLLILGGCSNCCPDYHHIQTKTQPLLIWEQDHYDQVVARIEEHLKQI